MLTRFSRLQRRRTTRIQPRSTMASVGGFRMNRLYGCDIPDGAPVTQQEILDQLNNQLQDVDAQVIDNNRDGSYFSVHVQSSSFNDISMVKQHQLVNQILKDQVSRMHAISIKTLAKK
eukprot:TRINITY_DN8206_c0_g1_i1.p2 TRINITY_DN8206_c0_g1~~TRINITY_DN8206_c0_g1_i1.p2  ORF type:complete len:118 (-),score=20.03 TRINITY_DN8206_c0_g1_i1:182-535(-)